MKELQPLEGDKIEVKAQMQQEKQLRYIGQLKPQRGHKCWQLDLQTGDITEAEYEKQNFDYSKAAKGDYSLNRKLIIKDHCLYVTALNRSNADKKFKKLRA